MLTVGVPKEIKTAEHRVAMTPDGVRELERHGIDVFVEAGAGDGVGDHRRRLRGRRRRRSSPTAADAWAQQTGRQGEGAAGRRVRASSAPTSRCSPTSTSPPTRRWPRRCSAAGTTGIAYETVQLADGRAAAAGADERGRRAAWRRRSAPTTSSATTAGAACCSAARPACGPARVVVLGAGNVGWNAAWIAAGMEAEVVLLDKNLDRLRWVDQIHQGRIMTLASNRGAVERAVAEADLVIGAVLVAGGRAPVVVDRGHGARR